MFGESALIESAIRYGIFAVLFVVLFIYTIREHKIEKAELMEELKECRAERVVWLAEIHKISQSQAQTADTQRETVETLRRLEIWLHSTNTQRERMVQ